MPHVSLDARKSQLKSLLDLPGSLPANTRAATGPWSAVPVWRGLDSDFLCSPAIPKAPAAPRVKVEMVGQTLRILDEDVDAPEESVERGLEHRRSVPQYRLLLIFAFVGFLGGIIVAWLLGALK